MTGMDEHDLLKHVTLLDSNKDAEHEHDALIEVSPGGFLYRPPQPPHKLISEQTQEDDLFQTIHMGAAVVDTSKWCLVIDGLVERPISITWSQLLALPKESITAFHECYGSPIKPPDTNLWRIGNVTWTGVPLKILLDLVKPKFREACYVWSDGLEHGSFFEAKNVDRYQKDMPLSKALTPGCLVAYEMNGASLGKERGGPVRLIVPGWYGTNSTKWLCRLSVQATRSKGPFTTIYYNEIDPTDANKKRRRPCWDVEPNSFLLTTPSEEGSIRGPKVKVAGRAWSALGIEEVSISMRADDSAWVEMASSTLPERIEYEWQYFENVIELEPGKYHLMARATDKAGTMQPVSGRRNHAHTIEINVT